jgi:hypothetical protein
MMATWIVPPFLCSTLAGFVVALVATAAVVLAALGVPAPPIDVVGELELVLVDDWLAVVD